MESPAPTPEEREAKTVLVPDRFTSGLFHVFGGRFIPTKDRIEKFDQKEFLTGEAGKQEKLESAQQGLVIVQRGIVTTVRERSRKVLVSERIMPPHAVTGGGSILVSGDGGSEPESVLRKKVIIDDDEIDGSFEMLGYGFSPPEQTKGILYLFEVHRLQLNRLMDVKAPEGRDPVQFLTYNRAKDRILGKRMEEAILNTLN